MSLTSSEQQVLNNIIQVGTQHSPADIAPMAKLQVSFLGIINKTTNPLTLTYKKRTPQSHLYLLILLLLISFSISQQVYSMDKKTNAVDSAYPSAPEKVVDKYCAMDAEGLGLSGNYYEEMQQYRTWDHQGGDSYIVISSYKIKKVSEDQKYAKVKVTYSVIGEYTGGYPIWKSIHKTRNYIFTLIKEQGVFKIKEPQLAPHIYLKTAIRWTESSLEQVLDDEEMKVLRILKKEQRKINKMKEGD